MTADAAGGVWTYAVALLRTLAREGVTCTLAVTGPPLSEAALLDIADLPHVSLEQRQYRLEWLPGADEDVDRAGEWLLALADRYRPDLVHVNGYAHAALPFACPVLLVAHSCVRTWWRAVRREEAPDAWNAYTWRVRQGLASASMVVAPTGAMLDALRQEYGRPPATMVIHNGLPAPRQRPGRKRDLIFSAGRIWDEAKNISALDAVAGRLPWPVMVAGDAVTPEGRSRTPEAATYLGRLAPADVHTWMARAAIYALPARYEPFGLSVLEAAQRSCALVLGDIPSLRELWTGAAEFVPPGDTGALEDTIAALIDDPDRRRALARAARVRASRFSEDRMARHYAMVYRTLAGASAGVISCAS